MADDDDTGQDDGEPEGDAWTAATVTDEHACPECGRTFKTPGALGLHRKAVHGVESGRDRGERNKGKRGKRDGSPRRTDQSGRERQSRRARQVRETLEELTTFSDELRGRNDDVPAQQLADVIRRDASKIADSLAWVAERLTPVGLLIDRTMGHGGIITIARGFTGVIGHGLRSWRQLLARRQSELNVEREAIYLGDDEPEFEPEPVGDAPAFDGTADGS